MSAAGTLPNLLVIGAQKAGTTLLHNLLDAQPAVAMSATKELDFFSSERGTWRRGLDWYRSQFDPRAAVRGESSPSYTAHPFAEGVPERIATVLDEVHFVYVVRDPIERLVSALAHAIGTGEERRGAAEILDGEALEGTAYVAMSRYAMQLERYMRVFGADRILVVQFEQLTTDPATSVAAVLRHCGIEPAAVEAGAAVANPGASWPLRRALRRALPESTARRLLGLGPLRRLDQRMMRGPHEVRLSGEQRERLKQLLTDDARRLREMTGLELADWSV